MRQNLRLPVIHLHLRLHLDLHVAVLSVVLRLLLGLIRNVLKSLLEFLTAGAQIETVLLQDDSVTAPRSDNKTAEKLLHHQKVQELHHGLSLHSLLRNTNTHGGLLAGNHPQDLFHLALAVHLLLGGAGDLTESNQVECHQLTDK